MLDDLKPGQEPTDIEEIVPNKKYPAVGVGDLSPVRTLRRVAGIPEKSMV